MNPRSSGRSRDRVGKHWLFVAAVMAAAQAVNAAPVPQVLTESGAISGISERGLSVYKGVPFAAAPVGDLRWRAPAAVAPWTGIREADAFAAACMQEGVSMPGETPPTVSEDCLYLNIWTPAKSAAEHLPVIVWIHGGGYRNGYAAMPLYWGDRLARKGVIVVTIAYRLGPLGFLALPELTRESPHRSSGNYGLMDQIAALEWVQRNIAGFGGDPRCVTIAGQSSGSISVSVLLASPRAKGLFQRAIGESGGLFEPLQLAPSYLLGNPEQDGEKYVASLGVASLEELRRLPAARLTGGGNAGGVTHPVIEPYLLPVAPYEAFAAGRQNDVPLLIGSNAEEARSLTDVSHTTAATFAADIERSFGRLPPAIIAAYPHATDAAARKARLPSSVIFVLAGTCGRGPGCKPPPDATRSTTTRFASGRRSRSAPCTRDGEPATSPSSGTCSTIWTKPRGTGVRGIEHSRGTCPRTGAILRGRATRTAGACQPGPRLRTLPPGSCIWATP